MSNRPKVRLDYKLMHKTGEKVEKVSDIDISKLASKFEEIPIMSQAKASVNLRNYKKIVSEINDCIEMNDLDEMKNIELIDDYISDLTELLQKLRYRYEVMQDSMSNEDFEKESVKHMEVEYKIRRSVKSAKSLKTRIKEEKEERIRKEAEAIRKEEKEREERIRKEEKERDEIIRKEEREREEKLRKEERELEEIKRREDREWEKKIRIEQEEKKEKLRIEQEEKKEKLRKEQEEKEEKIRKEIVEQKVVDDINSCQYKYETLLISFPIENLEIIEDIRSKVEKMSEYMAEYKFLIKKMNTIGIEDEELNQMNLEKMVKFINEGNLRMKTIGDVELSQIENRKLKDEDEKAKKVDEECKLRREKENVVFTRLMEEIDLLDEELMKIKDISITQSEDSELLIQEQKLSFYESEINKFANKITSLVEQMPLDFPSIEETTKKYSSKEKEIRFKFNFFKNQLIDELKERNISKENLAASPNLTIKLEKFKGYDSVTDIYTFQSEFEKLYQKSVQKKLLPDFLKNNYIEGAALILVRSIDDLEAIWNRLKEAYGDTELLLGNKLQEITSMGEIWKFKNREKLVHALSKLSHVMMELKVLAERHKIENELYYGGSIPKVYKVIGYSYSNRFIRLHCVSKPSKKDCWNLLIEFLKEEIKFQEELILKDRLLEEDYTKTLLKKKGPEERGSYYTNKDTERKIACFLCGKTDHTCTVDHFGRKVIQYFSCKSFVDKSPKERFKLLLKKGLCYQCLVPGAQVEKGKHSDATCYNKFVCKNKAHDKYPRKLHVLLCEEHKDDPSNAVLLSRYKKENIENLKTLLPEFTKQIKLSFVCRSDWQTKVQEGSLDTEVVDSSVYILQTVQVEDQKLNIFFDTGCEDLVCKKEAVTKLSKIGKANLVLPGPIALGGIGNVKTESSHGIYKLELSTVDGNPAIMCGVCLDKVTPKFPRYPLKGKVEEDIMNSYKSAGNDPKRLPRLPKSVGGETDIIVGIKYLKYFPEVVFRLPTGLTIYESPFVSPDGSRGVVGGPHQVFTMIEKHYCAHTYTSLGTYFVQQVMLARKGYQVNPDIELLCCRKESVGDIADDASIVSENYHSRKALKHIKLFETAENAGSEVSYRCIDCRNCKNCKRSEQIETVSIQEEIEQDIINRSVDIDVEKGISVASLPFVENPFEKLTSNKHKALAVYKSQVRKLEKSPVDRSDVIKSEKKLQDLGFVDFVEDLTVDQKKKIENSSLQNFIPWRAVWNQNSLSTPCRLVFDASQITDSGYSLNSILAKGRNNMNKLVQILIRWMTYRFAYHTDIQKMYNTVKLVEEDWCYQLYLWNNSLSSSEEPQMKVIKTIIYGVKSSGNQAERALRETARIFSQDYPRVSEVVHKDIYVDDCMSGENSWTEVLSTTDELKLVLSRGGFAFKGLTFSGKEPPSDLSDDKVSIKVAGMKWFSKEDKISLDCGDLNFARKHRGKKTSSNSQIPDKLTRRQCVGKVAEVFDLLGKVTPITCGFKLDLRTLVDRKLDWDDPIPNDLKTLWIANFQTIQDLSDVRFNRSIVPTDAISLEIDTIDSGDASNSLACAAIYARYKKRDGTFSCQLVFAKSKLIPDGMTLPRAELLAAYMNATTGHVVKLSFGSLHKEYMKITDNQVTLNWISNTKNPLKQWVRNKVVEINRLTNREFWRYVNSKDMVADIATRKGSSIADISENSSWINGLPWMSQDKSSFPVQTVQEIKLSKSHIESIKRESLRPESLSELIDFASFEEEISNVDTLSFVSRKVDLQEVQKRYEFSNYVIDPNRFRLRKVVRVLALVMMFIRKTRQKVKRNRGIELTQSVSREIQIPEVINNEKYLVTTGNCYKSSKGTDLNCKPGLVVILTDSDIKVAFEYFFKKSTLELIKFSDKKSYQNITVEKCGILYYTGRILPSQEFEGNLSLSDVIVDLTASKFMVPVVDNLSPLAFSIVNEVHWYDPVAKHSGNETVLRYTMKYAHITGGRELVKQFRKDCPRCRILAKRTVDVIMGPVSKVNLTIAPAFYISQVDLFGPYKSYSIVNKRAAVSIWFVIFCCCTTGAINIKVMESYSTDSFILSFIRFACSYGYPKMLLPDSGSQLVKGCKDMKLSFNDIRHRLNVEYGIEFETCPVGGHNMHGKVERKIQQVKVSMSKQVINERLSIIQWETLGDQIANCVNDLPLALKHVAGDIEQMDILTPNRLMLARNNDRSPSGPLHLTNDPSKIIARNAEIMTAWFEVWLISHVPKLMHTPKWFKSDRDVKVGDVVLFTKKEKEYAGYYQYGIIKSVELGKDKRIRTVSVEYKNHNEDVRRETRRAIRDVVMIHPIDELGIIREIGEMSTWVDMSKKLADLP